MTGSHTRILVSILSWDSPRYLANLLDNIAALPPTLSAALRPHFHILDQGSGEEVRELIRRFVAAGSNRTADLMPRNIGFSRGHNRVFDTVYRRARFDFFVPLNQDVVFGRAGWLDRLVEGMSDERVAIGGPVAWELSDRPGALMQTCGDPGRHPERIFSIQASVAIVRTTAVERLGLFDAEFTPAYFEDTDLCRRYLQGGYRQAWIPVEQVHAYLGRAEKLVLSRKDALRREFGEFHARNRARFMRRWMTGEPPTVTPETLLDLWPNVFRPVVQT